MVMHNIKINEDTLVEFDLGVICHKEGDAIVAYIPALDLSTHGSDLDDAIHAAVEASKIFVEELIQMGTAEEVLTELGWSKSGNPDFPYLPPSFMSYSTSPVKIQCHA